MQVIIQEKSARLGLIRDTHGSQKSALQLEWQRQQVYDELLSLLGPYPYASTHITPP